MKHRLPTSLLLILATVVLAEQHHAPYTVLEKGEKVVFDKIAKEHLGRLCSVYHKPEKPIAEFGVGREDPEGMVTKRDGVRIVTGEFYAFGRRHIEIVAFYTADPLSSGSRHHHIRADDINYLIMEKKTGQPAAAP